MKYIHLLLLSILIFTTSCINQLEDYVHLPGMKGPMEPTQLPEERKDGWKEYARGGSSQMAVYLAETGSAWTGIVHSLRTWGVPVVITRNIREALKHKVVMIYPIVSGKTISSEELQLLKKYVTEGGYLIGTKVLSKEAMELFGVKNPAPSKKRYQMNINTSHDLAAFAKHPMEKSLSFANKKRPKNILGTYGYGSVTGKQLITYNDRSTAMATRREGKGRTLAIGFDIGFFYLRGFNDTDDEATLHYINHYEPTIDVITRLLVNFYRESSPGSVTLGTVPDGKSLSVIITHDVDYAESLKNSIEYAAFEKSQGASATYFMQTKYFTDYFDTVYFNDKTKEYLDRLVTLGMEIGSHSVVHSDVFSLLPVGDGKEYYPKYQPRIMKMKDTRKASVLGELRVSKYLLEHFTSYRVVSFRPGFLSYPKSLPQALEGTGYLFSSAVAGNNVMTQMPYRLNYNRNYRSPSKTYEFPLAIEDEHKPRLDKRIPQAVALAEQLRKSGGICIVLIHPNITGYKLKFLKGFLPAVKKDSWLGNLDQFGRWWLAREHVHMDTAVNGKEITVTLTSRKGMKGLTLVFPQRVRFVSAQGAVVKSRGKRKSHLIEEFGKRAVVQFRL